MPAEVVPVNFPVPGESSIASYNYTDIANGLGYSSYYPNGIWDGSAVVYLLMSQTLHSQAGVRDFASTNSQDLDLSPFNTPKTLMGTAYFQFSAKTSSGASVITATIKKVSGASVTSISSAIASSSISTSEAWKILKIPLTKTNFKIGDILRLTLAADAGTVHCYVGVDPTNTASTITNTQSVLSIPSRISL